MWRRPARSEKEALNVRPTNPSYPHSIAFLTMSGDRRVVASVAGILTDMRKRE